MIAPFPMKKVMFGSMLLSVYLGAPPDAGAAKLEAPALKAWDTYVQLTEKRIEAELNSTAGFLRTDFLPSTAESTIAAALKSGRVYIERLNTRAANGREVSVPDGMIHHWFGSIFLPNVRMETV